MGSPITLDSDSDVPPRSDSPSTSRDVVCSITGEADKTPPTAQVSVTSPVVKDQHPTSDEDLAEKQALSDFSLGGTSSTWADVDNVAAGVRGRLEFGDVFLDAANRSLATPPCSKTPPPRTSTPGPSCSPIRLLALILMASPTIVNSPSRNIDLDLILTPPSPYGSPDDAIETPAQAIYENVSDASALPLNESFPADDPTPLMDEGEVHSASNTPGLREATYIPWLPKDLGHRGRNPI